MAEEIAVQYVVRRKSTAPYRVGTAVRIHGMPSTTELDGLEGTLEVKVFFSIISCAALAEEIEVQYVLKRKNMLMRPGMFRLAGQFLFVIQAQQGSCCFDRSGVELASIALASWHVPGFLL